MKKIALDTNIVLDALCNRPEAPVAQQLIMEIAAEHAVGVITANAITDIYFIATKYVGAETAREAIKNLLAIFDVAAVDGDICGEAAYSLMDDFEDAVFVYACERENVDYIATRDQGLLDSKFCPVEVCSPQNILKLIGENE